MDIPIVALVSAFCGLLLGYFGFKLLGTPYKRRRALGRLSCLMGDHSATGPVVRAVGARNVRYCDRCGKACQTFEVTKAQAQGERDRIRRIM